VWTNDREEAQRVEAEMIAAHAPVCNRRERDNNRTYLNDREGPTVTVRFPPELRAALKKPRSWIIGRQRV
jgi:hypothetical protein